MAKISPLQAIRRHQFAAGDIRIMSERIDHRPKAHQFLREEQASVFLS
jgi:hypothetical protein